MKEDKPKFIKTNISTAYWCTNNKGKAEFKPAEIKHFKKEEEDEEDKYFGFNKKSESSMNNISWFDNLFDDYGIKILKDEGKPITFLISGPPGSGKTTLALELCLRVAICHDFWSLYISTESETNSLIDKVKSLKIRDSENRLFQFDEKMINAEDFRLEALTIYGQENIKKWNTFSEILTLALEDVSKWLIKSESKLLGRFFRKKKQAWEYRMFHLTSLYLTI